MLQKQTLLCLFLVLCGIAAMAIPPGGHPKWAAPGAKRTTAMLQNLWLEDFNLPDGTTTDTGATAWTSTINYAHAIFGVYNKEFEVNNASINGTGAWTSAAVSIAGKTNIQLSVSVRSAGSLEADGSPHADYLRCYYKVDSGAEVLFSDLNGIINNNSSTDSVVYSTGVISGSTVQIIVRDRATATDEFYYFDNVTIAGTSACTATAAASVSNTLTCARDSVQLLGSSATAGAAYSWSGPNNFASAIQNPFIQIPGTYTLMVTAPGGCTASSSVAVAQNIAYPEGVTANGSNQITCNTPLVNLVGSSTTAGVVFSWTGPNGFTASGAIAPTGSGGIYTLTVTNPANGCAKLLPAIVAQNTTAPAGVTATNSGPLTCELTSVTLSGNSTSPNVEYEWNGPDGYLSFTAQDIAIEGGDYILTVTNDDNGCTLNDTTTVENICAPARKAIPADSVAVAVNGAFAFKTYPNPFSEKAVITFTSPTNDFVTVQVFNNNGVMEKLLFNNRVTPNQPYQLSLEHLPAGMHYVMIRVNNYVYTRKLVSLK